jgi:glutathione synthase/RimK-type ligase-like ATP-grasp enzyme
MRKRRRAEQRFANTNHDVALAETDDVLSAAEQRQLSRFTRAMRLDWGGLDVLRDRRDGRIYVVDVNKTDMGPPIAMKLQDKIAVTRRLADAFLDLIQPRSVS